VTRRGSVKQMQTIVLSCPSGTRKFTLVGPPFVKLGQEIEGYGTVVAAKLTKGVILSLARTEGQSANREPETRAKAKDDGGLYSENAPEPHN
jgi:hypothetical protein